MLDTLTLRTRAGSSADTTGVLSAPGSGAPRLTQFSIRSATVSDDGTIRINRMHAGLRIPISNRGKVEYMNTGIDQDVDVKEGQKIVVGRASLEGPEKALFLILTAKVFSSVDLPVDTGRGASPACRPYRTCSSFSIFPSLT